MLKNKTTEPQPIYRKDYKPSAYLIHTTELHFQLEENETIVSSKIDFYQNPKWQGTTPPNQLFLNGIDLELITISLDGATPDYEITPEGLLLHNTPAHFILQIKTRIHPETNTSLNGLYRSSGNFCTQCEAHGFRQITYYLDRPDVLSVFTTHIEADHKPYPILLSNGNPVTQSNGRATWHDPTPKPCYLFALVAGDFAVLEDTWTTPTGKQVALKIYVEAHNINKTQFAMEALKRAFKWDEVRFGLAYDLDIYMIVAVDDFNMGAMENKGLNIFNSACVLADSKTATDADFINIEAIIGHEYFHNWTGNRITCRDWFQLSLKEGLTVFRDQEFTADLHARSIKRIEDVNALRTLQFAEDAGPMAHPVRPEHYIEMNNFYTLTVYEKGAEVIRMIHTFLGETGFQKGMLLYFERFDGQAVTIDDFVSAMSDANNFDFTQFKHWYSQSGTPEINISTHYDPDHKTYTATITQKFAHFLPLTFALFDPSGTELQNGVLTLKDQTQSFVFDNLPSEPTPSWLRGFSAPVKLTQALSFEQKIFLVKHETDSFSRWDNAQNLWLSLIMDADSIDTPAFFDALEFMLTNTQDKSLICALLTLPSERSLHNHQATIDVFAIHHKREQVIQAIIQRFNPLLLEIYHTLNTTQPYDITPESVGRRALKNICLFYLAKGGELTLAHKQFNSATCMSDKLAAFKALIDTDNTYRTQTLADFYQEFKDDTQVMDKYFATQALSQVCTLDKITTLMQHELFCFNTPNRLRSVVNSFTHNSINFHHPAGYQFLTNIILKLNTLNPQIGARLVATYNHWRRFTPELQALQKQQLETILATKDLSKDIFEIVQAALKEG
ncbi:aminopeptidase N [Bathymodiolus thermophilus thioautotrophic gill symbiont]|uniref:Aminopeptidase N n=1 Tax=Bathymodiolus thermophilus thioautotrophic gill symbiont TaxID=2360 RepID=A0A8H9CG00_9GAMM|nr:aminopeptidase N [Bathymodiolus thermophilus thioautotrophic gill symbiont]CAB5501865.1 Membrane alanine aminopeptidase N (EC [Bathymodiolus thermophilus thioautotrophic gill symbiont]